MTTKCSVLALSTCNNIGEVLFSDSSFERERRNILDDCAINRMNDVPGHERISQWRPDISHFAATKTPPKNASSGTLWRFAVLNDSGASTVQACEITLWLLRTILFERLYYRWCCLRIMLALSR
jgi:hypothetical protein